MEWAKGIVVELAKEVSLALDNLPVTVTNDANAAAYGELVAGAGRGAKDFSVHKFGHALGMKYDYAHGATLSAVWGSWAEYIYDGDVDRFAHYAEKVWGVKSEDKEFAAKEGIHKTVEYFKEIGMPTNLRDLGLENVSDAELMGLAMDATKNGTIKLAVVKQLDLEAVLQIFKNAK